jgi:hypothetical protein
MPDPRKNLLPVPPIADYSFWTDANTHSLFIRHEALSSNSSSGKEKKNLL